MSTDNSPAVKHAGYTRISQAIRRRRKWSDDEPLIFADEDADLYFLSHESANAEHLLGCSRYECEEHGLTFEGERSHDDPNDCDIRENNRFRYPLLREHEAASGSRRHRRGVIVLHGLNERSFGKYLPWAYQIWRALDVPVLLFPIAFHINRVLPQWRSQVKSHLAQRRRIPGNENAHVFNAVMSARLEAHPERYFWAGVQSYRDVVDLVRFIRAGGHPHFTSDARIDFVGYSAGGYLALSLLLENHEGLFADSRAVLFETCCHLRDAHLSSPLILDLSAETALRKRFVTHLDKFANERLLHWLAEHPEGRWFMSFAGMHTRRPRLERRLREIAPRILGIANITDQVMPAGGMLNALQGRHRDTGVRVVELELGIHENPFSCPDYNQRDRRFITDFLDAARYGDGFDAFIQATLSLLR